MIRIPQAPILSRADKKLAVHSYIAALGDDLKTQYRKNTCLNPPKPKKREPTEAELQEFYSKPGKLLEVWRAFQSREGYLEVPKGDINEKLQNFVEGLIKAYNSSQQRIEDGKKELTIPEGYYRLSKLALRANDDIGPEFQEEFWNNLPEDEQDAIINEQKYKYATDAFRNKKMPRIVTQKIRERYLERIQANAAEFEQAGFCFLGLGFSGVVFLVLDSVDHPSNIPKYVLKIPACGNFKNSKKPGCEPSANPIKEKKALRELTRFSVNYEEETGQQDPYSQRLAYAECTNNDEKSFPYLVGRNSNVLATTFQDGINVYQTAWDDNKNRKQARELGRPVPIYNNPHVLIGVSVPKILEMIRYYMAMAEAKINFCDLYPHNLHYVPSDEGYKFIDIFTDRIDTLGRSVAARKAFPIDLCVFDLITFLVLHEQRHAFTIEIRKNIREMIGTAMIDLNMSKKDLADKSLLGEIYEEHLEEKFKNIKSALVQALRKGFFTIEQLRAALDRLTQPQTHSQVYRQEIDGKKSINLYDVPMRRSFERLTNRGIYFLEKLKLYFQEFKS